MDNGHVSATFVLKMGTQGRGEEMRHFSVEVPRVLWGVKKGPLQCAQKSIGGNIKGPKWRRRRQTGACQAKGKQCIHLKA